MPERGYLGHEKHRAQGSNNKSRIFRQSIAMVNKAVKNFVSNLLYICLGLSLLLHTSAEQRDSIVSALDSPAGEQTGAPQPSNSRLTRYFGDIVLDNNDSPIVDYESRIVNGEVANVDDYPFLVSLRIGTQHYCAGSIVHPKVIVTAAHCVEPVRSRGSDVPLVMTSYDVERRSSKTVGTKASVVRGGYNAATHDSDIAILLLNEPLEGIEVIPMAPAGTKVPSDAALKIVGWGLRSENAATISPSLMEATVGFVDSKKCDDILGEYGAKITENMICAGDLIDGRDACQGDSGGPLVFIDENGAPTLLGVVSWGIGCGRIGIPGIYSSVPFFNDWVQSYLNTWEEEGRLE